MLGVPQTKECPSCPTFGSFGADHVSRNEPGRLNTLLCLPTQASVFQKTIELYSGICNYIPHASEVVSGQMLQNCREDGWATLWYSGRPMTRSAAYPHAPAADVGIGGAYGWLQCILYFMSGLLDQVMWSSGCQGEGMMLLVSVRYKNAPSDGQSYPHSHKLHTLASFCRW